MLEEMQVLEEIQGDLGLEFLEKEEILKTFLTPGQALVMSE